MIATNAKINVCINNIINLINTIIGCALCQLASSRWDFMSCETDFTKTRSQTTNTTGKQLRCFKKRIVQQNKYSVQPYTDWGKKIFMIQNEVIEMFST